VSRKKHKSKRTSSQLVSFLPDSYLDRTSRPIYALTYLLGFMLFYEIGTFLVHPETLTQSLAQPQVRVVAFVWVQNLLEFVGFSPRMTWVAAPFVVMFILVALQITSKTKWQVHLADFIPMTLECIFLAVPLIVLSLLLNRNGQSTPPAAAALISLQEVISPVTNRILMVDIITGIGAGIYEELIFRLILICILMMLFQDMLGMQKNNAIFFSVLISAVLFSAHHHFFFASGRFFKGDPFTMGKFVFRAMAGVYFAALYAVRGFGITAGTHAFYNILAAVLKMLVFFVRPV
jgi:membrane protease YdiL (CAAX protease family)